MDSWYHCSQRILVYILCGHHTYLRLVSGHLSIPDALSGSIMITVYVVWTMEDSDSVDIYLDQNEANKQFEDYGEFGCWEEKSFSLDEINKIRTAS